MALKEDLEKLMNYESPQDKARVAMVKPEQTATPDHNRLCKAIDESFSGPSHADILRQHMAAVPVPVRSAEVQQAIELLPALQDGFPVLKHLVTYLEQQSDTSGAQWQPIETAPRDGTELLLYCGHQFVCGKYCHDLSDPERKASGFTTDWPDAPEPTHWMPLPANPEGGVGNA